MNIDNYLKQLTIDIDNQKLQETILNKSAKTTSFDFKIKNMTQSNPTQVSSFLKNDIIDKLNRLVDSVTAMRVYNFLISNNLMDTFLKSYEYLLNYKNYNVMSYNDIINYILSYASSSKGMLDFLKEDLKEKLKSKTDISQLKQLNKITTNANVKNKIKIASQKIPTQEKINKVQNIDILQQMINDADFLPDKAQVDKILSRTRRTKIEMKEAELMGFEDIRSLENKQTKLERKMNKQAEEAKNIESQFPLEYSEKVTTKSSNKSDEIERFMNSVYKNDLSSNFSLTELENLYSQLKKVNEDVDAEGYPVVGDESFIRYELEEAIDAAKTKEKQYQQQIFSKNKFDDPEYDEDLKQNYIDKYNIGVNNKIQIDNKEFDIIMEELNKKSQIEKQEESSQNLSQETNITEEELLQDFENMSQEFENIMTPTKSQEEFEPDTLPEMDDPDYDIKMFNLKEKLKREEKEEEELPEELPTRVLWKIWKNTYKLSNDKIDWGIENKVRIVVDVDNKKIVEIKNPKTGDYIKYGGPSHKALTKPKKGETIATMSPIIWNNFIKS